jgi:5-deoxy-glucuronate isomerase
MSEPRRFLPAGSIVDGDDPVRLTPIDAGWTYCGLHVMRLAPGESRTFGTGDTEVFVLPLSATDVTVTAAGEQFALDGRTSVFARVSDFAYVGRDTEVTVTSASGGEIAIPSARCERALPARYGSADDVAVEVRGAGQATRSISNFGSPESWAHADKLMCVEVYTPDGNWSSYPPHKHDDSPECPVNNEEAYYFRIGQAGSTEYAPDGFGMHRTYTGERPDLDPSQWVDDSMPVADGDVYVIPRGYHGPCIAAPGYSMYYLNVLAGPGGERSMAFCDDPTHHWIRGEWDGMPLDPRCPMVTAAGPQFPEPTH